MSDNRNVLWPKKFTAEFSKEILRSLYEPYKKLTPQKRVIFVGIYLVIVAFSIVFVRMCLAYMNHAAH